MEPLYEVKKKPVVAQGFSQWPEDYGEMYAPVVKLNSVWILLFYTNHYAYDIFIKQILEFPEANTSPVLCLFGHIVRPQTILLQMV